MKKLLWIGGIVIVALVIASLIVSVVFLNDIVKTGVETVGPKLAGVPVTLDKVNIQLLTGSAKVEGLVIGNPPGYKAPNAINVGLAEVGVNPFSILSDKIVVRSVHVIAPEINFEGNPLTGNNNISKILDNLNAAAKTAGKAPATNQPAAAAKPAKKLEVDDFLISDAKVQFNGVTLPLPPVHLTDLGKGPDGITAADLSKKVFSELTSAIIKAVASSATDIGTGAGKNISGEADKIKKGIGGLFGK